MALPSGNLIRNVVEGTIGGDTWSCGVWTTVQGMSGTPTQAQMDVRATTVLSTFQATCWGASTNPLKGFNASGVALTKATATFYASGVVLGSGTHTQTAVVGTGSTVLPFFTAIAVTLRTATAGRRGRGRMYFPHTAAALTASSGQTTTITAQAYCDLAKAWLNALKIDDVGLPGDPTFTPVVVSQVGGIASQVITVTADTLLDTQHGRTNKDIAVGNGSATL